MRKTPSPIFRACPALLIAIAELILSFPALHFAQLVPATDGVTSSTLDTATLSALDSTTLLTSDTATLPTTDTSTVSSTTDTLSSTTSTVTSTLPTTDTSLVSPIETSPLPVTEILPLPGLQLPQLSVDTTLPQIALTSPSPASTIFVPAGGDLQSALNNAQPGSVIALEPGAIFTGNFVLPNKGGTDWVIIRSSAPDSSLPPPGTRITPAFSGVLPKIVSPNTAPAITTDLGAHHYRFIGVEVTTTHSDTLSTLFNLIWLEYPGGQTSVSQAPTDIIFDRVYIHGTPAGNVRRGLFMNSARTAVIDSYLSDFHEIGADSQAILICNGPGPFKITNNYLEGAGENFMSGGCDPTILNLVPSDIEIRGNHFFKPLKWRVGDPSYAGIHWSIKNLFELKNAQRVLIDGNVFENNWSDAQSGFAIQLTQRNQDGTAPWSVVQDVTFINNIVRHTGSGVNILGWDNINPTNEQAKRILIQNNLFEDVSSANWGGSGILFQLLDGTANIFINHNTGFQDGNIILADGAPHTGFVFQNNITPHNLYGVIGTGTGIGNGTLAAYFPGAIFANNVIPGGIASSYPPNNFFPASLSDVGFSNLAGADYRLLLTSPFKFAGTDGKDVGADLDAINAATAGISQAFVTTADPTANSAPMTAPAANSPDPLPVGTLAASDGGGGGGSGGGGCFIATAAYGSALEPQVVILRRFRDLYLMRTSPGRSFVEWYYRASPPVAERIRESQSLRAFVRLLLWPLVGVAWLTLNLETAAGMLIIGASALTAWIRCEYKSLI